MKKILSAYDIMDSMVESYSKNANHNIRRPVVKEEIVDFMRTRQAQNTGFERTGRVQLVKKIFQLFHMKQLLSFRF